MVPFRSLANQKKDITVLWNVVQCILVERYQYAGGTCSIHLYGTS
jgi:hypothetical protein